MTYNNIFDIIKLVNKMEVLIDRMDHQGRGIGKIDNKIVFIDNALPNELVDVEITYENKKYLEGKVIRYIKKSKDRIESLCPHFIKCGGCDLMHIDYEQELTYKESKIKQIIDKFSSLPLHIIKPIVGSDIDNYRNKATFHIKNTIGYYEKKSNDIISIDKCYIVDNNINEIFNELKKLNLNSVYEIVIRVSKNLDDKMIVLKGNNINEQYYIDNLKNIVDTIIIYQNKNYKTIYGKGYILDKIGNFTFKISPDSFFQVNTVQAKILYDKVLEYLRPNNEDNILDLYCGTGTIGIYVSNYAKKIKGIEINKYAIKDAFENKRLNNIDNIEFECLDASLISKIKDTFDKIIIDPPRSGLDKKTTDYLIHSKSKRIVYVSCDPITLARDLKVLKDYYDILEITPIDMFPKTSHVETVCLLERKIL